eukprot:gnl/Ergobibamus_cyprinoides/1739.p2 GENE.gnl/Ergobibamus_cyprinoides/1739~~gnl/Ergobibamus_cyprinoides/1739.p2  ORF type:complete len:196 (+),score=22.70 gnl/Ergobibamus_cyprinoides/1739:676-1263(+)
MIAVAASGCVSLSMLTMLPPTDPTPGGPVPAAPAAPPIVCPPVVIQAQKVEPGSFSSVCFSPSGAYVLAATDLVAYLIDVRGRTVTAMLSLGTIAAPIGLPSAPTFSPDETMVLRGTLIGTAAWEIAEIGLENQVSPPTVHPWMLEASCPTGSRAEPISAVALHPYHPILAAGGLHLELRTPPLATAFASYTPVM